jgi:hypothetical protein
VLSQDRLGPPFELPFHLQLGQGEESRLVLQHDFESDAVYLREMGRPAAIRSRRRQGEKGGEGEGPTPRQGP